MKKDNLYFKQFLNNIEETALNENLVIAAFTDNRTGGILPVLCRLTNENNIRKLFPLAVLIIDDPTEIVSPLVDTEDAFLAKQGDDKFSKEEDNYILLNNKFNIN